MRFSNRVVIVTGSGSGIGRAVAIGFAKQGGTVVLCGRTESKLLKVKNEIEEISDSEAIIAQVDVTNEASVESMVANVMNKFGQIDILVNNAGVLADGRVTDMTVEDWDIVVDTTLKGAFLCSKHVVKAMTEKEYGRIINISSRSYLGNPGQANYSAAKAGLIGLSRALSKELGTKKITVNAVAPGLIDTELIQEHPKYERIKELQIQQTPIKRIGYEEDVVNAVLFFADEATSYITGDILHVTGGRKG